MIPYLKGIVSGFSFNNIGVILYVFAILCTSQVACQQITPPEEKKYEFIAKIIRRIGGDKIQFNEYLVLKNFSDSTATYDTITVGYKAHPGSTIPDSDTVLLKVIPYHEKTAIKNYFICPGYKPDSGIFGMKYDRISFDFWEKCEMGIGDCPVLVFHRPEKAKLWYLFLPCGGTESSMSISNDKTKDNITTHFFHPACPPVLNLSTLPDGDYQASITSCNLGGTVRFRIAD